MTAIDWFWTGRNNAVDRQRCGVRREVGLVKVLAYWLGVAFGRVLRAGGARVHS